MIICCSSFVNGSYDINTFFIKSLYLEGILCPTQVLFLFAHGLCSSLCHLFSKCLFSILADVTDACLTVATEYKCEYLSNQIVMSTTILYVHITLGTSMGSFPPVYNGFMCQFLCRGAGDTVSTTELFVRAYGFLFLRRKRRKNTNFFAIIVCS